MGAVSVLVVFFFSSPSSCLHPLASFPSRLETVYSDSIRKAELEARLSYLKVSPLTSPHMLHASFLESPPPSTLHPLSTCLWSSSTCCFSGSSAGPQTFLSPGCESAA